MFVCCCCCCFLMRIMILSHKTPQAELKRLVHHQWLYFSKFHGCMHTYLSTTSFLGSLPLPLQTQDHVQIQVLLGTCRRLTCGRGVFACFGFCFLYRITISMHQLNQNYHILSSIGITHSAITSARTPSSSPVSATSAGSS